MFENARKIPLAFSFYYGLIKPSVNSLLLYRVRLAVQYSKPVVANTIGFSAKSLISRIRAISWRFVLPKLYTVALLYTVICIRHTSLGSTPQFSVKYCLCIIESSWISLISIPLVLTSSLLRPYKTSLIVNDLVQINCHQTCLQLSQLTLSLTQLKSFKSICDTSFELKLIMTILFPTMPNSNLVAELFS